MMFPRLIIDNRNIGLILGYEATGTLVRIIDQREDVFMFGQTEE